MKKLIFFLSLAVMLMLTSCGKKVFMITTANENLRSLSKITDGKNPALDPNGGGKNETLFYVVANGKESNIYKKDNPLAPSQTQVTSGNNVLRGPWYCPAIDRVAFGGKLAGSSTNDISMMPATKGTAIYPITESVDAGELWPCISNDGTMIAYQRAAANGLKVNIEIWVKNLVTGESAILGGGAVPRFSPDGKKIAYVKYMNNNQNQLWVMNVDGSNSMQLTDLKKGTVDDMSWSPDGSQIVFSAKRDNKKDYDLYIINNDGSNLHQITINESSDLCPFWSNDNFIYFSSDRGAQAGKYQIWRFQALQ